MSRKTRRVPNFIPTQSDEVILDKGYATVMKHNGVPTLITYRAWVGMNGEGPVDFVKARCEENPENWEPITTGLAWLVLISPWSIATLYQPGTFILSDEDLKQVLSDLK